MGTTREWQGEELEREEGTEESESELELPEVAKAFSLPLRRPLPLRLGMAEEARRLVQARYAMQDTTNKQMRFPGFYGNIPCDVNYLPDDEHAANARTALQWMLLQDAPRACATSNVTLRDGSSKREHCDQILILPAWPSEWKSVSFKLWAWHNTTVQLDCREGVLQYLEVLPKERRHDLVFVSQLCRPREDS